MYLKANYKIHFLKKVVMYFEVHITCIFSPIIEELYLCILSIGLHYKYYWKIDVAHLFFFSKIGDNNAIVCCRCQIVQLLYWVSGNC